MPGKPKTRVLLAGLAALAALLACFAFKTGRPAHDTAARQQQGNPDRPGPSAASGEPSPPGLYAAFTSGGPILIGIIAEVKPAVAGEPAARGDLTLEIEERLRGQDLPDRMDLTFELHGPDTRRPAASWDRVPPRVGKRICVLLDPAINSRSARCVLDLDGEDKPLLPVLQRMVELEALPEAGRRLKLLAAISDPEPWIRALATERFLATEVPVNPRARSELLAALAPTACDRDRPLDERLQSVSAAGLKVYDGFSADDPVNYEVLAFLARLLTDPSLRVRGEAVHILHGYLLGAGTRRPSARRIQLDERERALGQLRRDVADQTYFADAAGELLSLFSRD